MPYNVTWQYMMRCDVSQSDVAWCDAWHDMRWRYADTRLHTTSVSIFVFMCVLARHWIRMCPTTCVCVCMCMCASKHMNVYVCMRFCMRVCTCLEMCACARAYMCENVCRHERMHVYVGAHVHVWMCTYACTWLFGCICRFVHSCACAFLRVWVVRQWVIRFILCSTNAMFQKWQEGTI